MITYGKYDESDSRTYSIELEECHENDVPEMLDRFEVGDEVNFAELEEMVGEARLLNRHRSKACSTPAMMDFAFPALSASKLISLAPK